MPAIFWIACPKCGGKFYVHYELKGRDVDLYCPWCKKFFPQREGRDLSQQFADLPAQAAGETGGYGMG